VQPRGSVQHQGVPARLGLGLAAKAEFSQRDQCHQNGDNDAEGEVKSNGDFQIG
jgi:hypothetical protein